MSKHTLRSLTSAPVALRRGAPRRGQALLLAVLVMVFAALIGSTFITVVALNMDRTSAQQERVTAANAARNGLDTVNYQLNANGTDWRPEQIAPPPAPGAPDYNFYYTPQEIAGGFARISPVNTADLNGDSIVDVKDEWIYLENEKNAERPVFVKFPDPRNPQVIDAPTYLAEVRVAGISADPDKQGMLRVTIVGTSPNDPKVLVPRVAYKGTSQTGGAFTWDFFHTNWDYQNNKTATTELVNQGAPNQLTLKNVSGFAPGRSIFIQQGNNYEFGIVQSVTNNIVTLRNNTTASYTGGASVRAATTLMSALIGNEGLSESPAKRTQFNADGIVTGAETAADPFEDMAASPTQPLPPPLQMSSGLFSNTDLQLAGRVRLDLDPTAKVMTSGMLLGMPVTSNIYQYGATVLSSASSITDTTFPTSLDDTNNTADTTLSGPLSGPQQRVFDNLDPTAPEASVTDPARGTRPQAPPSLDTFSRLQEMTKYTANAALGLGDGVYINNPDDVEQVVENGSLRPLSNSDLQRLWLRKSFPTRDAAGNPSTTGGNADAPQANGAVDGTPVGGPLDRALHRLAYPRLIVRGQYTGTTPVADTYTYPINNPALSLEQRGIRGWINEQEFVPRGSFIELNGNLITITLDDRSEGSTQPDPSKAWPYPTGTNVPATQQLLHCYRMTIDIANNTRIFGIPGSGSEIVVPNRPFNGVIYAEGNVRVRGTAGAKDVTIVSMSNIYVEGNLRRASPSAGRIALLAKKNVVLNPTQFVTRVRGTQDRDIGSDQPIPLSVTATNTGDGSASTPLEVTSAITFKVGDRITVAGYPIRTVRQVLSGPGRLILNTPLASAPTGGLAITIQDVAAMVTAVSGNAVTVNAIDPFRVGDMVRFGNANQWHRIAGINGTILTFDPATGVPSTVVDDSVQLMADPGITSSGTPEYRYNLTGRRTIVRDVRMDGVAVAPGNGGYFRTPVRVAGTMRKAYELTLEPIGSGPGKNAAAVNAVPFANALTVTTSSDTSGDKILQPGEWHLVSTDPNGAAAPKDYKFDYDFLGASNLTLDALKTNLNATEQYTDSTPPTPTQVYKWNLDLPTGGSTRIMTAQEAQTIQSRCLMAGGWAVAPTPPATSAGNPWSPAPKNADDKWQLWLTSSGSLEWNGIPAAGLAIGSPPLATDNADLETMQPDFYFYLENSTGTPTPTQQWMRWIDRAAGNTITNDANIIRLTNNNNLGPLPLLRVSGVKLERDDFVPPATGTRAYDAMPVAIEATVFAQEGSWFVIPMPNMNRNDVDHDPLTPLSTSDIASATRMRRLNYDIQFTGRIIQNHAPTALYDYDDEDTPDATEAAPSAYNGAMAEWIDAMAHPTNVEAATATDGRGRDWQSIVYRSESTIPANTQLILPPSPDIDIVN